MIFIEEGQNIFLHVSLNVSRLSEINSQRSSHLVCDLNSHLSHTHTKKTKTATTRKPNKSKKKNNNNNNNKKKANNVSQLSDLGTD